MPEDPLWTAKQDSISLPALWLTTGLVYYVLLFSTGQWRHLVPTSWEVFPNALSVATWPS